MLKVVLDANIFISAALKPHSRLAKILELVNEEKVKLILSDDILAEVRAVLFYPKIKARHKLSPKETEEFITKTARASLIIPVNIQINEVREDPQDNKYLSAALEGKADFIVSGDHHLKDMKAFQGIRILDPATFLELMTNLR